MTAKDRAKKARIAYNELIKEAYFFMPQDFEAFCQQLCKEQRAFCANRYYDVSGKQHNPEIEKEILNGPSPEIK